jgi:hypothetical protein
MRTDGVIFYRDERKSDVVFVESNYCPLVLSYRFWDFQKLHAAGTQFFLAK